MCKLIGIIYFSFIFMSVMAQDLGVASNPEPVVSSAAQHSMFYGVVFGGGFLGILIWFLLFLTSTAAIAICIRLLWAIRRSMFISEKIPPQVTELCQQGELSQAYAICGERQDTFSQAMCEVFKHYHIAQKTHEESASAIIAKSAGNILRQINTLQMCGNIAPMLGLLGTVTGMVSAFMGLGTAMGPEKASVLAVSISQALYTTAAGLLIAVPCLALVNYSRNTLERRVQELNENLNDALLHIVEIEQTKLYTSSETTVVK